MNPLFPCLSCVVQARSEGGEGETRPKGGLLGAKSLATQALASQHPAGEALTVGLVEQLGMSRTSELFVHEIGADHGGTPWR